MYEDSVVQEVTNFKNDQHTGILDKFNGIVCVLEREKIIVDMILKPSQLMCHMDNRGGLGLNAYNAHRVGKEVMRVGVDESKLWNAYSFEISSDPTKRAEQFEFNKNLIRLANGLLAELTGLERCQTVGARHMTAFFRAVDACCRTTQADLKDADGNLDKEALYRRRPVLKRLIEQGYKNRVLPASVEETWPWMPDLFQRALNAHNSIPNESSELEVAACIAQEALQNASAADPWKEAVNIATAGGPSCASYAHVIARWVRYLGDGEQCPFVKELDAFHKCYASTAKVGEEFFTALVDTKMHASKALGHVKQGFIATNLTSPRVVDGVSKLLTKSDINVVKGKPEEAIDADDVLKYAQNLTSTLVAQGRLLESQRIDVYGRFLIRMVGGFLCGKGKLTFEKKHYETALEVKKLFAADLLAVLKPNSGEPISFPWDEPAAPKKGKGKGKGKGKTLADDAERPDAERPSSSALTLETLEDPKYLLNSAGFAVEGFCVEKCRTNAVFEIIALGEQVVLKERSFTNKPKRVTLPCTTFMKGWHVYKREVQIELGSDVVSAWSASFNSSSQTELAKSNFFTALLAFHEDESDDLSDLAKFRVKPSELVAAKKISKGELTLAPMVGRHQIVTKSSPSTIDTGTRVSFTDVKGTATEIEIFLVKPQQPNGDDVFKWRDDMFISPFFGVAQTQDKDLANMVLSTHQCNDQKFPIFRNTRVIAPGDKLAHYAAPQKVAPLIGAKVEPFVQEPASKKQRKSQS